MFFGKSKPLNIFNFVMDKKGSSWCDYFKKKRTIQKKSHFFILRRIFTRKWCFLENQNRWRYEILKKTKKFRLDVTISRKKKESKKSFFDLRRIFSRKKYFGNQNRWRYVILLWTKKFCLDVTISKRKEKSEKSIFLAYCEFLAENDVFWKIKTV